MGRIQEGFMCLGPPFEGCHCERGLVRKSSGLQGFMQYGYGWFAIAFLAGFGNLNWFVEKKT